MSNRVMRANERLMYKNAHPELPRTIIKVVENENGDKFMKKFLNGFGLVRSIKMKPVTYKRQAEVNKIPMETVSPMMF